ncbi:MAG TPA: cell wall-binding repeat-containing protein [Acidimicrobiales bacterium]|nr:cell wall-binding repeat-containing protein [Acidimicrobiales bacterium]
MRRRRRVEVVLAGLVAVGWSATVGFGRAQATPAAQATRVAGADRIATAVAASQDLWGAGAASAVVLARFDTFPDALAGTPLAVAKAGPLLLTPPTSLDSSAAGEIQRVLPKGGTVYLLGGTAALSDGVFSSVQAMGYQAVRYGGADRYQTAAIIDEAVGNPGVIFEATGLSFPYALISGVAAAHAGGVVVLTSGSSMPAATSSYLAQHQGASRVAVGSEAAAADPSANPVVGSDQYQTSTMLAGDLFQNPATVGLASGTNFPDALSGGAHIGHLGGPLLLTDPNTLPPSVQQYLSGSSSSIGEAVTYGGTAAVSEEVENAVQAAVTGPASGGPACSASMSDPTPGQGGSETLNVTSNVANTTGSAVVHYKTTNSTYPVTTDANGSGFTTFSIGHPTLGYQVRVDVTIGSAACSTSFTPQ